MIAVINCRLQVSRLETQLQRLKQTSENYEKNEDDLRAEKRKIMRDVSAMVDVFILVEC